MPPPFFPDSACIDQATALQTELALSEVKLFKSGLVPDKTTTLATLAANEADYTTYAAEVITAWLAPQLSDLGGAQITAPSVQFVLAATPAVPNTIGGYWIETAGGAVRLIRQFDNPVPMVAANQGLTVTPTIVVPNGQ